VDELENRQGLILSSKDKQEQKRDPNNPCLFCTDPQGVSLDYEFANSARDTYPVALVTRWSSRNIMWPDFST